MGEKHMYCRLCPTPASVCAKNENAFFYAAEMPKIDKCVFRTMSASILTFDVERLCARGGLRVFFFRPFIVGNASHLLAVFCALRLLTHVLGVVLGLRVLGI